MENDPNKVSKKHGKPRNPAKSGILGELGFGELTTIPSSSVLQGMRRNFREWEDVTISSNTLSSTIDQGLARLTRD